MKRTITAVIGLIILYVVLLYPALLAVAMALLFFQGARELAEILQKGRKVFIDFAVLGPIPFFILPLFWGVWGTIASLIFLSLLSSLRAFIFESSRENKKKVMLTCFSAGLYLGFLPSHLIYLRMMENGRNLALVVVMMVVSVDIGAFVAGRTAKYIGHYHIISTISPKKTWEGGIFGLALGILVPYLMVRSLVTGIGQGQWLVIGAICSITAQAGDFFESWMKRKANVKDSSGIIPGHGGVLDRFDSHIVAIPTAFYMVIVFISSGL